MRRLIPSLIILVLWVPVAVSSPFAQAAPSRFRVTLSKDISSAAVSGRLFLLMTDSSQPMQTIEVDFIPGSTWVAAMEIEHFPPAGAVEFDANRLAFPRPFSQAKPGAYQIMALLDQNHSYAYRGQDEGDLTSEVVKIENLNSANSSPIELALTRRTPPRFKTSDTETVKLAEFQSPLLSAFWGRAISMRAGVVLPPSYGKDLNKTYPAIYHVHGFGGDHSAAWRQGPQLVRAMSEGKQMEMIHVFLDGSFPTGHHEFADSANNGPWGGALTEEFIPHLEKKFRLISKPHARFLTGHSSGGWSTLWLQITYPDFFGGTWSTAPDPVDLRSFTGIDATPISTDNAYRHRDGRAKNLVRMDGREVVTIEEFARMESVMGEYGGQFASFEWVWSPRGEDGRPMKLFNRASGELNQATLLAWQKYDIRLILEKNWATLGPKLKGKINVICGGADTFHLEEAVIMLCEFFKRKGSDAVCEIVPGRDHGNLYESHQSFPEGLSARIYREMAAKFQSAAKTR
ncbi:MAG: alpha/beta hydrolase [Acidobacteriota bacterium]